jgi:hypothetical protein
MPRLNKPTDVPLPQAPALPPRIDDATQGHNFGTQFAFDVNKQLGKLETCLDGVEKRLEKVEFKVDQMQVDIACLKTTTGHIETIMQSSVKALWGIFIVVLAAFLTGIVTIVVYWVKAKGGI